MLKKEKKGRKKESSGEKSDNKIIRMEI